MRRFSLIPVTLAVAAAVFVAAPSTASASGSCSTVNLFPPTLGGGVTMKWQASCTVAYDVETIPQYLVPPNLGWFRATKNNGATLAGHTDADNQANLLSTISWTFMGLDQTPYCSFDWRAKVTITNHATGATLFSGFSPELAASC